MLAAGPISLVDLYTPVDRFSLFASLSYPHALQQTFVGSLPVTSGSYRQDLADFITVLGERKKWLKEDVTSKLMHFGIKGLSLAITEYIALPGYGDHPSQFCLITAFSDAQSATDYRKHFNP